MNEPANIIEMGNVICDVQKVCLSSIVTVDVSIISMNLLRGGNLYSEY